MDVYIIEVVKYSRKECLMSELTIRAQQEINGGAVLTYLAAAALGASIFKIFFSSSGRLSIPYIISLEWK